MKQFYLNLFSIDLRSLALYRILLASLLIVDWFGRARSLEAFYTAVGVLPNTAQLSLTQSDYHYSILTGATTLPVVQVLFGLGLLCYVGLLLGVRTRFFHVASLVFFASVLNRNQLIAHGGDTVLLTMCLWTVFLPLGKRFSLDARRAGAAAEGRCRPTLAAFVAVAQLGLIYTLSATVKSGELWKNGTALYYALQLDLFATDLGGWVAQLPIGVLQFLSYASLFLEFAGLPLILLPWPQPYLRWMFMIGLGGMHLGTAVLMRLGTFPFAMIAAFVLLWGEREWDLLGRLLRRMRRIGLHKAPMLAAQETHSRWLHAVAQVVVAVLFASVLVDSYNLSVARPYKLRHLPEPGWMRGILEGANLIHGWYMFAPNPMQVDGWWVIDGVTNVGSHLDPLTGKPPVWTKPANIRTSYDLFWRAYMFKMTLPEHHKYRVYYGRYLTRLNRRQPVDQRLSRFDFYRVLEPTQPPGTPPPFPTTPKYLWSFDCTSGRVSTQPPAP